VKLPGDAPDPYDSVLVLKIEGEPDVEPAMRWDAPQSVIDLTARDCSPHGPYVRYSEFDQSVGGFVETNDKMLWHLLVKQPARYTVEIEYARTGGEGDATFRYTAFGKQLDVPLSDTAGRYQWRSAGTLDLTEQGLNETRLSPRDRAPVGGVRVRALRLTRAAD
jgi:hypothetical protein